MAVGKQLKTCFARILVFFQVDIFALVALFVSIFPEIQLPSASLPG